MVTEGSRGYHVWFVEGGRCLRAVGTGTDGEDRVTAEVPER